MAAAGEELKDSDLSKLTKVLPCGDSTFLRRFAMEYLVIPGIQYTRIHHNHKDQCEEVLYECLSTWRNRSSNNNKSALVSILDRASQEENWVTKTSHGFLRGDSKMEVLDTDPAQAEACDINPSSLAEDVKTDILDKCKIQMIPWLESERFSMEELFTPLELELNETTPSGIRSTKLDDFNTLLEKKSGSENHPGFLEWLRSWFRPRPNTVYSKPKRILVKAEPGCGKSTFVSKLAWDWAKSAGTYFALVLVVTLKLVRNETSVEDAIIEQHASLATDYCQTKSIKHLLHKHGRHILILLDGYDEMADNKSFEDLIKNKKYRKVNLILTSRLEKTDYLQRFFSDVVTIVGFTYESAFNYVNKVTSDADLTRKVIALIDKAKRELWKIPIFLLFLSVLATENFIDFEAPFYTEFYKILRFVYKSYIHRQGRQFREEEMEGTFLQLGKLAYEHMSEKTHFVGTEDEILELISSDALNCGFLIRQKNRRTLESPAAEYVFTFQHTVIQEVLLIKYQASLPVPRTPPTDDSRRYPASLPVPNTPLMDHNRTYSKSKSLPVPNTPPMNHNRKYPASLPRTPVTGDRRHVKIKQSPQDHEGVDYNEYYEDVASYENLYEDGPIYGNVVRDKISYGIATRMFQVVDDDMYEIYEDIDTHDDYHGHEIYTYMNVDDNLDRVRESMSIGSEWIKARKRKLPNIPKRQISPDVEIDTAEFSGGETPIYV